MTNPPLRLDRSFFTEVVITANPQHKPDKIKFRINTQPSYAVIDTEKSRWQVELDIIVTEQPDPTPPPYSIHLHSFGFFTFPETGYSEEEKVRMLAITGVSILYSQAREYLLLVTSRGPWGAFQLPTASFVDGKPSPDEESKPPAVREKASTYKARGQSKKRAPQTRPKSGKSATKGTR